MKRLVPVYLIGAVSAALLVPNLALAGATSCNDDPGVFYTGAGTFFGRDALTTGGVDRTAYMDANPGWLPISGDWDGSGTDGLGIYNVTTGAFFLANSFPDQPATPLAAEYSFFMSVDGADFWPVAGDWDGDGSDGVGIVNKTTGAMFLVDDVVSGGLSGAFLGSDYGLFMIEAMSDWLPIAGNWNGTGGDGVGIYNTITGAQFLANDAAQSLPATFLGADYGLFMSPDGADYYPITGDWEGTGADGTGIWNIAGGAFFLANDATGAALGFLGADISMYIEGGSSPLAGAEQRPVAGCWVADN